MQWWWRRCLRLEGRVGLITGAKARDFEQAIGWDWWLGNRGRRPGTGSEPSRRWIDGMAVSHHSRSHLW